MMSQRITRKGGRLSRRRSIPASATPPGHLKRFGARVLDDLRHDPYQPRGKYAAPTHCAICGAVYERGSWRWGEAAPGSHAETCPACKRTQTEGGFWERVQIAASDSGLYVTYPFLKFARAVRWRQNHATPMC